MNTKGRNFLDRQKNLSSLGRFYLIVPAVILGVDVIVSIIFAVLYLAKEERVFLILLIVFFALSLLAYIAFSIFMMKRLHAVYYEQIYLTTYSNIKKLAANDTSFDFYRDLNIDEVDSMNDAMHDIKKKFDNSYLVVTTPDYTNLNLEYVDKNRNLITFESFKKNLFNIIHVSQSFKNTLISVAYMLDDELSEDDKNRILNLYFHTFNDYERTLFMFGEDGKSLIIYLPVIDSLSRVKEQLELTASDSSIVIREAGGLRNIAPRYALVVYPYSSEEYLLSDLRYARRQNKNMNIFIPNRIENNIGKNLLMSSTMNHSYMSKILSKISTLEYNATNSEESETAIKALFDELVKFLELDEAGIIVYDDSTKAYRLLLASEGANIFQKNKTIDQSFISSLESASEDDGSYYFSTRNHANKVLGRQLDFFGIKSGYYQVVTNADGRTIALIYFFNRYRDFYIDSYLRESFFMLCLRIAHYFEKKELLDYLDLRNSENEYILSMSDYMLYKSNDEFTLTYLSNDLKKFIPKATIGGYCYKELYGFDRPCNDCPKRTFKAKEVTLGKKRFELSLNLNERKKQNYAMLLKTLSDDEDVDSRVLFNENYLTYSYYSLHKVLKNEYTSSGRGYVLLLTIDNFDSFLESQKEQGLLFCVRSLIRNIKNKLKISDVYLYNPSTIAIHLPSYGHADVLNICENIYDVSKEHYLDDGSDDQFKLTYLPVGYPRGYASVDDFMRHMGDFYRSDKNERGKDFIYFCDYAISRSASKREFMLSVIENEFSGQSTASVNLQPIVQVSNKHIYGAEILLRINDVHRGVFFNAEEISRIAEKENKTHIITESIINFVGNLYKEHGKGAFKINDFERIAINIDQTYLKDPNLIKSVIELVEKNNIPDNFISFEIPEDMIPDNIDKIKDFANQLKSYHIFFSCDRFTGEYIGSEKLKDLGFNEVKIARNLIIKIDKDPIQLKAVEDIVKNAHNVGIKVAVVGVENEAQYNILKNLDNEMVVQGYYFYKPLTRSDLISAIVSYN